MVRVLFIAPRLQSGVGASLEVLVKALSARGFACAIFGLDGDPTPFHQYCSLGAYVGGRRVLARLLIMLPFDIVHVTAFIAANRFTHRLLRLVRVRSSLVCTAHSSAAVDCSHFPAAAFTAVSESAAAAMKTPAGRKPVIIPNAPDLDCFEPWQERTAEQPLLLWVGRTLDPDWRAKDVLGFLYFVAQQTDFHCVLVDERDHGEDLGVDRWLQGRIDYRVGLTRQEMAALYQRAGASNGALLSTSAYEGLPMTLLEAWASKCPVVVPRVPGYDLVQDGANGIVYRRDHGLEAITEALKRLPEEAPTIAEGGQEAIVRRFSPEIVTDEHVSLYEEVLR